MQNHKLGEAREEVCPIKCIGWPKQWAKFFPVLVLHCENLAVGPEYIACMQSYLFTITASFFSQSMPTGSAGTDL